MMPDEFERDTTWLATPVSGAIITARFGESGPNWTNKHTGMDFAAIIGSPVRAVMSGIVMKSGWESNAYGNLVKIRHTHATDTVETWYAHLLRATASGAVEKGEVIGFLGATGNVTGPHVHLEVRVNGRPVDPAPYLGTQVHPNPEGVGPQFGLNLPDFGEFGLRAGQFVGGTALIIVGAYGARKSGLI